MMLLKFGRRGIVSQLTRSLSQSGYGRIKASFPQLLNPSKPLLASLRRPLFDDADLGVNDGEKRGAQVNFQLKNSKGAFFNQLGKQLKGKGDSIYDENVLNSIFHCDGTSPKMAQLKETLENVIKSHLSQQTNKVNSGIECENFPQLFTVYMAACYKLNTPSAFKEAYQVYQLSQNAAPKSNQMKKQTVAFLLALGMNQKQFDLVLEIMGHFPVYQHTILFNSIRVHAYAELGEFSEVSYQLKYPVLIQKRLTFKGKSTEKFIYQKTLINIGQIIRSSGHNLSAFQGLVKKLKHHRLIEKNCTLEEALFKPIGKKLI